MSFEVSKFSHAEIGVFWDLDDCPVPSYLTPVSIYANIKLALSNMGYTGKRSVVAYSHEKLNNEQEFKSAGINLIQLESHAKREKICKDLVLWGARHSYESANLMLISKDISDDWLFVRSLRLVRVREHNILFAFPQDPSGSVCVPSSVWLWSSLATGGSPLSSEAVTFAPASQSLCLSCKKEMKLLKKRGKRLMRRAADEASSHKPNRGKGLKKRPTTRADEASSHKPNRGKRLKKRPTTQADEASSHKPNRGKGLKRRPTTQADESSSRKRPRKAEEESN